MTWASETFININTTDTITFVTGIACTSPKTDGIGASGISITVMTTFDTFVDISTFEAIFRVTVVTGTVKSVNITTFSVSV